jgi:putative heme-binding domain-containing protein
MPHFGSTVVDERGIRLIHDWIESLPAMQATSGASSQSLRQLQRQTIANLAAQKTPDERKPLIDQLLSSTSGALLVSTALDRNTIVGPSRSEVIQAGATHADVQVRDLFERFVPQEQRIERLGSVVKADAILALSGNVARGKAAFAGDAAVACRNCHRIGNEGKQIGPDLSTIGKKYDRARILESILEPSKAVDPKFAAWIVETKTGLVHTGVLVERTEQEVVLKDISDKTIRVPVSDVETIAPQQKSLMPELLLRDMTAQQVADLLAYLDTLK